MSDLERRKYERKPINIPATVRFPTGITIDGNTRDISLKGAVVDAPDQSILHEEGLAPGELGFITIKIKLESEMNSIKAPCEVKHLKDNGVGLSIDFLGLTEQELDLLENLLASA